MDILLSIKPRYVEKIFSGIKKYEYRKKIPIVPFKRVYVYSSSPVKKIVGYFDVDYVIKDSPSNLWDKTYKYAGIESDLFQKYFWYKDIGYAIHISNVVKYDVPLDPHSIFGGFSAPQSFMYFSGRCKE